MTDSKPLTVFVQSASECLTDHESHGDGLICFSLLNGLAERGHTIYAYTPRNAVKNPHPRLQIHTEIATSPANSLIAWEHSRRADNWFRSLAATVDFDLVWRMHPFYDDGCPRVPFTAGKPLIVGPIPYKWHPESLGGVANRRSRFGIGIGEAVRKLGAHGWHRTMENASLVFCMTESHARQVGKEYPHTAVEPLPVIVEPPTPFLNKAAKSDAKLSLVFVANLVANKHPTIFCETIKQLRDFGVDARGTILGDGTERADLERFCAAQGIDEFVDFKGRVPNAEVYNAVATADFLLSASLGEPYGRGIVEAMAVGTPCITHRSGGPADFITDSVDGVLVDDLAADAYANRLHPFADDPTKVTSLGENAYQTAQNWRAESVLSRLETSLYAVVVSTPRQGMVRR